MTPNAIRRITLTASILALAGSPHQAAAQVPDSIARVLALSGCWDVTVGTFTPAGGEANLSKPPAQAMFADYQEPVGLHGFGWPLYGLPPGPESSWLRGWIVPQPGNRVDVEWSSGFVGVESHMTQIGDTLRGTARYWVDYGDPDRTAPISLVRAVCRPWPHGADSAFQRFVESAMVEKLAPLISTVPGDAGRQWWVVNISGYGLRGFRDHMKSLLRIAMRGRDSLPGESTRYIVNLFRVALDKDVLTFGFDVGIERYCGKEWWSSADVYEARSVWRDGAWSTPVVSLLRPAEPNGPCH